MATFRLSDIAKARIDLCHAVLRAKLVDVCPQSAEGKAVYRGKISNFEQSLDISLTVSDVLNTYKAIYTLHTTREMLRFDQNFDNRWLQLRLAYSFQKGLQKSRLKADKSLDEIKQRVQ